jgi:hypothetical protein
MSPSVPSMLRRALESNGEAITPFTTLQSCRNLETGFSYPI